MYMQLMYSTITVNENGADDTMDGAYKTDNRLRGNADDQSICTCFSTPSKMMYDFF